MFKERPFIMSHALLLPFFFALLVCASRNTEEGLGSSTKDVPSGGGGGGGGFVRKPLVKREDRMPLMVSEFGEISAVDIINGMMGLYHLQFLTLEPNSLLLPVLLHADMVFYVHTGSGKLSFADDGKQMKRVNLRKGDVYRLLPGSVFFLQSNLETEREKLRIHAIFSNADDNIYEPSIGAYSRISDLILGFDRKLLQSAFKVSEDVIQEITSAPKQPAIVHAVPTKKSMLWELEARFLKTLVGGASGPFFGLNDQTKKSKAFNILDADHDFENCNGWSVTVEKENYRSLKGSNIGIFMVNLTKGSMMGPHWNPMATEIAVVLQGRGMIRVVCASSARESECKNMRFRVKEGDVFAVPRFRPMAQMSFNNDSFVFMGFTTTTKTNYPQFLAGKRSVLRTLDRQVLAVSFDVSNTTLDQLLVSQEDSVILDCTSCADEEERIMMEEIEREKQEEEAKQREEERKRKEEEEKRQEEEAKKEQEEARRQKEEMEKRKKQQEEEERRQKEEERRRKEAAKREQEEARRQEEERQKRHEQQEEEARKERERQEEAERQKEEERERRQKEKEEEEKERERGEGGGGGKSEEPEKGEQKGQEEGVRGTGRRALRKT